MSTALKYRKKYAIWDEEERYMDNSFYGFTRGKVLLCTTDAKISSTIQITYHPFTDGTELYNIFDSNDVVTVTNKIIAVFLNGEPKILLRI